MKNKIKQYEQKIKSHYVVSKLIDIAKKEGYGSSFLLTGGAIFDIIDGRKPKDYDFIVECCSGLYKTLSKKQEFKVLYTSNTSITYLFDGKHIVQFLRADIADFPFENDKVLFNMKGEFDIDRSSLFLYNILNQRIIIVNHERVSNIGISRKLFKARVNKWKRKGFYIHPISYKSYLKKTHSNTFFIKLKKLFTDKEFTES